jgi:hypothetical protein
VAVLPFADKQLATAAAEHLAPIVTVPESIRVPPQCSPNIKNCKRWVHRMHRLLKQQRQAGDHRSGH